MFADDHRVLTSGPFPDDDLPRASSLYYIFIFLKFSDLQIYSYYYRGAKLFLVQLLLTGPPLSIWSLARFKYL